MRDLTEAERDKLVPGADLSGIDLHDVNLTWMNLCKVNLSGANLRNADLRVANLCEANLTGADLTWADLTSANLWHTKLCDVKLYMSCWPLWGGSSGAIVDSRLAQLLAAHLCAVECDDPEFQSVRTTLLPFALKNHRAASILRLVPPDDADATDT